VLSKGCVWEPFFAGFGVSFFFSKLNVLYSLGSRLGSYPLAVGYFQGVFFSFFVDPFGVGVFGVVFKCCLLVVGVFSLLVVGVFVCWCLFCFDFGLLGYHLYASPIVSLTFDFNISFLFKKDKIDNNHTIN